MESEGGGPLDRFQQNGVEFLALSTAAAVAYSQVMERELHFNDVAEMNSILQSVANALSNVAPIYTLDAEAGTYKQLEPVDLLFGAFQRGATVLRTSYAEYKGLSIRRADMRSAIAIFRRAGVKFPQHPSTTTS